MTQEAVLPSTPLFVGVAQSTPERGDIEANLKSAAHFIHEASKRKADVVLFPEKFLTGYEPELVRDQPDRFCISLHDERLNAIARLCTDVRITALIGAPTMCNGRRHISSIVLSADGKRRLYHKRHLYGSESQIYTAGHDDVVLRIREWNVGLAICYDAAFTDHARRLALAGCHVYAVGALFSKTIGQKELRAWMPARARSNAMYVAMANHCGITGSWDTCGNSGVWDPFGDLVACANESRRELIVTELSPDILRARCETKRNVSESDS